MPQGAAWAPCKADTYLLIHTRNWPRNSPRPGPACSTLRWLGGSTPKLCFLWHSSISDTQVRPLDRSSTGASIPLSEETFYKSVLSVHTLKSPKPSLLPGHVSLSAYTLSPGFSQMQVFWGREKCAQGTFFLCVEARANGKPPGTMTRPHLVLLSPWGERWNPAHSIPFTQGDV